MTSAKEIVSEMQKFAPTEVVKFDQAAYDTARQALAQLIIAEAKEMAEGEDEEMSFAILFGAISSLMRWHEHEEAEGETGEEMKSADPIADATVEEAIGETKAQDGICPECGKDEKMCKCSDKAEKELVEDGGANSPDIVMSPKSAETEEVEKSLTEIIPSTNTEDAIIPTVEPTEFVEEDSSTEKSLLADINLVDIVEKAVKSAMKSVEAEVAELKSAKEAVENKAASLEQELATAKSLAIGGGPKRTTIATGSNKPNEALAQADLYFAKASATTDQELATGYRMKAKEYLAKSAMPEATSN